jgi:hypothetical protein
MGMDGVIKIINNIVKIKNKSRRIITIIVTIYKIKMNIKINNMEMHYVNILILLI